MLPKSIQNLIDQFAKLPGIGPRMAARLTFYLLTKSTDDINELSQALSSVTSGLQICTSCGNMSEEEVCKICQNPKRVDHSIIVVEEPLDVIAFEKANFHPGKYHVLGGVISPINGVGPEHLRIQSLIDRVAKIVEEEEGEKGKAVEVVLATNPSLEGEATASYLVDKLSDHPVRITRIARGLPMGSEIEFADPTTLTRAIEGRKEIL